MYRNCKQCQTQFEITDVDLDMYDKLSPVVQGVKLLLPPPTLCPTCRKQRRCVQRNDRNLYHRQCDNTGQMMISCYSPDKPYKVYNRKDWLEIDNRDFGRDFDFSRPFFEQYQALQNDTIKPNVIQSGVMENSDYANFVGRMKNGYMCFDAGQSEDVLYVNDGGWNKSLVDNSTIGFSELCYECINVQKSYNLLYSKYCNNCSDSAFLQFCNGCKNCLGCINLRNQEYCILNKKVSKEQYQRTWNSIFQGKQSNIDEFLSKAKAFFLTQPHQALNNTDVHDVTGDQLVSCEHVKECYNCFEIKNCAYCDDVWHRTEYFYDVSGWGFQSDFCYESIGIGSTESDPPVNQCRFSVLCFYGGYDVNYSKYCLQGCQHLFGCSQLRKQKYCILNKQYTKEEYEALIPKIIEHMKATGEWGEFFPSWTSEFAYNETWGMEFYPLTREEAHARGFLWKDKNLAEYQPASAVLPESSLDIDASFCREILTCRTCQKNYKITSMELAFYQNMKLPLPQDCPQCRYERRLSEKSLRQLWNRNCDKCGVVMQTSYSPDDAQHRDQALVQGRQIIYCEECYLAELY